MKTSFKQCKFSEKFTGADDFIRRLICNRFSVDNEQIESVINAFRQSKVIFDKGKCWELINSSALVSVSDLIKRINDYSEDAKGTETVAKETSVVAKEPKTVTKGASVVAKEPKTVTKGASVVAKEPKTVTKGASVVAKEPKTVTKGTSVVAKEPKAVSKESSIDAKATEPGSLDHEERDIVCTESSDIWYNVGITKRPKDEIILNGFLVHSDDGPSFVGKKKGRSTYFGVRSV